jgi:hypothetical protein
MEVFIGKACGKKAGVAKASPQCTGSKVKIPTLISPKGGEIRMGHPPSGARRGYFFAFRGAEALLLYSVME